MSLDFLVKNLHNRIAEYRIARRSEQISTHINAVEIAVCVVEFALRDNREIRPEEETWFHAGYHVQLVLENSEWEDISVMYNQLIEEAMRIGYIKG